MQFADPFSSPGIWCKGNLHTHTTQSDGGLAPEQAADLYRKAGYDFLSLTDHDRVTDIGPGADDFLLLLGTEMAGDQTEAGGSVHVVAFGLTDPGPVPEAPSVPEAIAWAKEHGGEAIVAHPYWSGLVVADLMRWEGHLGVEVFNSTTHVAIGKGYSAVHWDDLLGRGRRAWGFAVDDAHRGPDRPPPDFCRAAVVVKAPELTREAILTSLRQGLFYASEGPTIHEVAISNGVVQARTSPVKEINFVAQRWLGGHVEAAGSEFLTEAAHQLRGREDYLRVECRDAEGRWAWANPIFLGE